MVILSLILFLLAILIIWEGQRGNNLEKRLDEIDEQIESLYCDLETAIEESDDTFDNVYQDIHIIRETIGMDCKGKESPKNIET